jgi:hypothetical protein
METPKDESRVKLLPVALIYETSTLVCDHAIEIRFKHCSSFRLLWVVCRAIKENPKYYELGGVPPQDIEEECRRESIAKTRAAMNTRWCREIEFRIGHFKWAAKYYDIKILRDNVVPPAVSREKFVTNMLQSLFSRREAPRGSGLHPRCKLFSVAVRSDQIHLFSTATEAQAALLPQSKTTQTAPWPPAEWDKGLLDINQTIHVYNNGHTEAEVSCSLVNLGMHSIRSMCLQSWLCSHASIEKSKVDARLKDGTELETSIVSDDAAPPTERRASLYAYFPPIQPGDTVSLTYKMPCLLCFRSGDNQLLLPISVPCDSYHLKICFARSWHVLAPILYVGQRDRDVFQPTLPNDTTIRWKRYFPVVGQLHTLFFHLSKSGRIS